MDSSVAVIVGRTTKNDPKISNDVPSIFILKCFLDLSILVRMIDGS